MEGAALPAALTSAFIVVMTCDRNAGTCVWSPASGQAAAGGTSPAATPSVGASPGAAPSAAATVAASVAASPAPSPSGAAPSPAPAMGATFPEEFAWPPAAPGAIVGGTNGKIAFAGESLHAAVAAPQCTCVIVNAMPLLLMILLLEWGAGYNWVVKDSGGGRVGPGNNLFSGNANNIWVDNYGMHHTVAPTQGCGAWACTETWLDHTLGYGASGRLPLGSGTAVASQAA